MIAAYAFFLGAVMGFIEGKTYQFFVGKPKLPPAWAIIFGLIAVPILSIGVWTEFKYTSWWPPIIIFTCEMLTIAAAVFRKEIVKTVIEPYPPFARIRNKLTRLSVAFNEPNPDCIWVKKKWKVIVERAFIPFVIFCAYLMIVAGFLKFMDPDEIVRLQNEQYQLIFFLPGNIMVSTYIVWQRWKEEVRRR